MPTLVLRVVHTDVTDLPLLHGVAEGAEVRGLGAIVVRVGRINLVRDDLANGLTTHDVSHDLAISVPIHVARVVQVGKGVVGVE